MITKDLPAYAKREWGNFLAPVTQLSRDRQNGAEPLVQDEKELYDFDAICAALFSRQNSKKPTSADALDISSRVVRLVEFKSGFRPKISRENFDEEKGKCKATDRVCEEYWKLFSKLQEAQTHELYDSIRAKAVESLLTLEKQVLPLCADSSRPIRVFYVVVIDADPVDQMEDILTGLGSQKQPDQTVNILRQVRNALTRLVGIHDVNGNTYCYDAVEVFSPQQYKARLSAS